MRETIQEQRYQDKLRFIKQYTGKTKKENKIKTRHSRHQEKEI